MNTIFLRSLFKINSDVLQNSRRLLAFKYEMTPAGSISTETTQDVCQANIGAPIESEKFGSIAEFNKNSRLKDFGVTLKQNSKENAENRQLQPSMLPYYYEKNAEKDVLVNPEIGAETELNNQNHSLAAQRFQTSKTYANASLPLKSMKLASPFPDPVKMMMSRTISDDEKAAQMLADSKSQQKHLQQSSMSNLSNLRNFSTDATRWFSSKTVQTNSDKCKKAVPKKKPAGCPKMSLKDCPKPRENTSCVHVAKKIDCKKQEAPYPAYSEFCHEEIEEKPSECKLCPWQPEENPNFKPQKKHFHTAQHSNMLKRTGLEFNLDDINFSKLAELKEMQMNLNLDESATEEEMLCDLRKPPCERPKSQKCPPKQEKKKEKKEKQPQKKEKLDGFSQGTPIEEIQNELLFNACKKPKKQKPVTCNVRKFKFPPCKEKAKEKEQVPDSRCPPKKKKRYIEDCPGNKEEKGCIEFFEDDIIGYNLSRKEKDGKTKKCPNVDVKISRDEQEKMKERCKKKKKDNTKTCPGDLIKKRRDCPETSV